MTVSGLATGFSPAGVVLPGSPEATAGGVEGVVGVPGVTGDVGLVGVVGVVGAVGFATATAPFYTTA